jgi:hypothetical protein
VGEKALRPSVPGRAIVVVAAFLTGFSFHLLYQRWSSPSPDTEDVAARTPTPTSENMAVGAQSYRVTFLPFGPPSSPPAELPLLQVRDIQKIRARAGNQARIRGRVFRVGHSAKTNTYFLNFGPSREALTAVIFASSAELFEEKKVSPKSFQGKEVEVYGEVKDHPQYGLEIIVENPSQIKVID